MADDAVLLKSSRPLNTPLYRVLGKAGAPWLVICHGLGGDHREFLPLAERLSSRWRVLLWDMPGHGDIGRGPVCVNVDEIAERLSELLIVAKVKRPVLLGFSFGGIIAQVLVRRRPNYARAIVAYACFAPFHQPPLIPRQLNGAIVFLTFGLRSWAQIKTVFASLCAVSPGARALVAQRMEPLGKRGFLTMTRALLDAFTPDPTFRLPEALLLIRGANDSNSKALGVGTKVLLGVHSRAESIVIPDAGHAVHLDAPEAFEDAIERFLSAL